MKREFFKLDKIKVKGTTNEIGYGYSDFVKLKLNEKNYTPVLWAWPNFFAVDPKDRKKVIGIIHEKEKYLEISGECGEVKISGPFIAGFPSIKIGKSPWGPTTGYGLGQIKDYKKINLLTEWKLGVIKGHANLCYDIWLTNKNKGIPSKNDLEVMIWLDYNFIPPYEKILETKEYIVQYNKYNERWNRIDFYFKGKSEKNNLNLIELFEICKKKIPQIENHYIRSIELGTELSKNSKIQAKIKKLKLDLKTK